MLELKDLSVTLDDGTAVVGETDVVIEPGERLLVAGESGTGKSTLVRAIAGLWPWGDGAVNFHPDRRLFMLPQKPYVPSGTLRRAVAYPGAEDDWQRRGRLRGPAQGRARSSQGEDRRRGAVGPDAVRRREAAPRLCAAVAAQPRHHRAGRGDLRARREEPGQDDGHGDEGAAEGHHRQRRPPRRAGSVPQPQDRAGAPQGRRQARQRHRPDPAQGQAAAARAIPAGSARRRRRRPFAVSRCVGASATRDPNHESVRETRSHSVHNRSSAMGPLSRKRTGGTKPDWPCSKTGYAGAGLPCQVHLKPDNDPSPAPFGRLAPNAAQAAIIALAQRTG